MTEPKDEELMALEFLNESIFENEHNENENAEMDVETHDSSSSSLPSTVPTSNDTIVKTNGKKDKGNKKRNSNENNELANQAKRSKANAVPPRVLDDKADYDVTIIGKKNMAVAEYVDSKELVRVTQIRGNFWKIFGYHDREGDFLHDEEALMLIEKAQLIIMGEDGNQLSLRPFYEKVMSHIGIPCYLTYVKLKALEYVAYRHQHQRPRCFQSVQEVYG